MPKLIKHDRVIDDAWTLLGADATLGDVPANGPVLVPFRLWEAQRPALLVRGEVGVWLASNEDPSRLAEDVARLPVIAVDFPKFGDGRGFSTARLLRERHGFTGELRAVGDIFRDQLFYLRECGFDAFAVRSDLDPEQELAGLTAWNRVYTASTHTPHPWFRERVTRVAEAAPGDVWFPCG